MADEQSLVNKKLSQSCDYDPYSMWEYRKWDKPRYVPKYECCDRLDKMKKHSLIFYNLEIEKEKLQNIKKVMKIEMEELRNLEESRKNLERCLCIEDAKLIELEELRNLENIQRRTLDTLKYIEDKHEKNYKNTLNELIWMSSSKTVEEEKVTLPVESTTEENVTLPIESTAEEKFASSEVVSVPFMSLLSSSLFPKQCDTSKNGTILTEAKQLVSKLLQKTDDYDSRTELYQLTQLLNSMANH